MNTESEITTMIDLVRNNRVDPSLLAAVLDVLNTSKQGILSPYVATGTNAYVVTGPSALTAYEAGVIIPVTFTNANSGASSINVNSIGSTDIRTESGVALSPGMIPAGSTKLLVHNGTHFRVVGSSATGSGGSVSLAFGTPISDTTYLFTEADNGKVFHTTNASGCTLTIPVGLSTGWNVSVFIQESAGALTLVSDGALESAGTVISTPGSGVSLYHYGSDVHVAIGGFDTPIAANSFLANTTGSPAQVQEIPTSRIPLFDDPIAGTPSAGTRLAGDGSWKPNSKSKSIGIESPSNSENITMFYTDAAIVVTKVADVIKGGSSSVTWNIKYASARNAGAPTNIFSADRSTSSEAGLTTTGVDNPNIPAGSWVWLTTSAISGTPTELNVTLTFTE